MASLEQLIQQNINPFDPTTFKPGNFWKELQNQDQEVSSIHQGVIDSVEETLAALVRDRQTRTLMLLGDSGSGKSHLLGRLKRQLNDRACFAYVGPWPDSQFIWRHVLRQTVDSLLEIPDGQSDPQLIRWLKGLEIFKKKGFAKRLMGERGVFIRDLRASFPTGLYQAKEFFGVLYDLLNPDLRMLAYDWLRGEDLDEEDLKLLRVNRSVESEDAAQKMLGNFGRIADSTQPIVICFDNLDNIPNLPNGKPDLQALFNVNSTIHNEGLNNFLILVSIITSNWRNNNGTVNHADLARVNQKLVLRTITLDQAEALWKSRLHSLHMQTDPPPSSPIAPLTRAWLEHYHPGGKVLPRVALMLAEQLIRYFKQAGKLPNIPEKQPVSSKPHAKPADVPDVPDNLRASFELVWQKEFKEVGRSLTRIAQFSSPELIRRLQEVLEALAVENIQLAVLPSPKYGSYSLGYQRSERVGVVWTEDGSLTAFCSVMKACQKMTAQRDCLYLIRSGRLGTLKNRGYQIFQDIFEADEHIHIKPDLASVQYLETYHRLVNAAAGGELVVGSKIPHVPQLQALIRESQVLDDCSLLQQLEIVNSATHETVETVTASKPRDGSGGDREPVKPPSYVEAAQRYILNLMATQFMIGMQTVIESTQEQVPAMSVDEMDNLIQSLCQTNRIRMLDPNANRENQLLCWVPA